MAKNILIFADGTGQAGGVRPDQQLSNIYKLFRATRGGPDSEIDPGLQVAYYDPGLGTATASGAVRLKFWERIASFGGLAMGFGFSDNVIDCYEAILKRYEPGDRIYLFGFSRGGYTVRAVANVLNLCGVPTTDGNGGPLPRAGKRLKAIAREAVVKVYEHGAGHPREKFEPQREAIAREFRRKYKSGDHPDRGDVFPEFIGVFDAVAALGFPKKLRVIIASLLLIVLALAGALIGAIAQTWLGWPWWGVGGTVVGLATAAVALVYVKKARRCAPKEIRAKVGGPSCHWAIWVSDHYDSYLDPRIPIARHALAIDETREPFSRVTWGDPKKNKHPPGVERPPFVQRWFPGNHSDIGGSYPEEESRLSDIALAWMLKEATNGPHPILWDREKLKLHPDPTGPQHCEVFAQGQRWVPGFARWKVKARVLKSEATLDESVAQRLALHAVLHCDQKKPYRPEPLRGHVSLTKFYLEDGDALPSDKVG
jgi:hypothetical protein